MASSNCSSLLKLPSAIVGCISHSAMSKLDHETQTPVTVSEPNNSRKGRRPKRRKKVAYGKWRCVCGWCFTPSPTSITFPQTLTPATVPRNRSKIFLPLPPPKLQSIRDTLREINPLQQDEGDNDQRGKHFGQNTERYWWLRARRMRPAFEARRQQPGTDQASQEGNGENKQPRLVCWSIDFLKFFNYIKNSYYITFSLYIC